MEEAYRYIEWPAVFLIAAMLPLGIAMQTSGAASFLTDSMINLIGDAGPLAVLAGLFVLSVLASQVMPNAAVVVLMAPIAIASATDMNVSPYTFMMGIAIAASASFMSPISHPANILVMGPGGYRFSDFIKIGLPLTVIVLIIVLILLPLVWPF
jgi:di/tricarboxylate transporter